MLAHAGFEGEPFLLWAVPELPSLTWLSFPGTSPAALDVVAQLAGQYISNLGRTLRFYSDRYSGAFNNSVSPTCVRVLCVHS